MSVGVISLIIGAMNLNTTPHSSRTSNDLLTAQIPFPASIKTIVNATGCACK